MQGTREKGGEEKKRSKQFGRKKERKHYLRTKRMPPPVAGSAFSGKKEQLVGKRSNPLPGEVKEEGEKTVLGSSEEGTFRLVHLKVGGNASSIMTVQELTRWGKRIC